MATAITEKLLYLHLEYLQTRKIQHRYVFRIPYNTLWSAKKNFKVRTTCDCKRNGATQRSVDLRFSKSHSSLDHPRRAGGSAIRSKFSVVNSNCPKTFYFRVAAREQGATRVADERVFTSTRSTREDHEEQHVGPRLPRRGTPLRANLRRITDTISSHCGHPSGSTTIFFLSALTSLFSSSSFSSCTIL